MIFDCPVVPQKFFVWLAFVLMTSSSLSSTSFSLRQHLLNGGRSYGPLLLGDSPIVAEMLRMVGYGHLVVDHEHSPTDVRSGQAMLQAIDAAKAYSTASSRRTETIVRLPGHDPIYMKKVLDSLRLPAGVLVPMVENAEMAKQVVRSTRYHLGDQSNSSLDGNRGCAAPLVRASGYGMSPSGGSSSSSNYLQQTRQDLLVMVQVETPQAIDNIEEIAEVEGVDGIFLGPLDLSPVWEKWDNLIRMFKDLFPQQNKLFVPQTASWRALEHLGEIFMTCMKMLVINWFVEV
jgi:2-keto-3-deoxy-L-rhamnonate aldolase RhmA